MVNKKEMRMEALKQAGFSMNHFAIDLTLPEGTDAKLLINGKEIPLEDYIERKIESGEKLDEVENLILQSGYVTNTKIHRRWITSQTFRMLNWTSYDGREKGWDAYLTLYRNWGYCFKQTIEEIRVISILEKQDAEAFEERSYFFNKEVIIALCTDYIQRLVDYIENCRKIKNYRGEEYCKTKRWGNILLTNFYGEIAEMYIQLNNIKLAEDFYNLYLELKKFFDKYFNALPYRTPLCREWKDAYKGSGAYFTLKNLVMFHDVKLTDFHNGWRYTVSERNVQYLQHILREYDWEGWRFHSMLKKAIAENNFDLAKSIEINKRVQ